ncbi:MAG: hypothetical protein ACE5FO_07525, partial [Parvularculaceae bacterium]
QPEPSGNRVAPKIAFSGEEYGFGYRAAVNFITENAGRLPNRLSDEDDAPRADWKAAQRLPLRTREQSLMAVKNGRADVALVPFHAPYSGYDLETLRNLASLDNVFAYQVVEAGDKLCLAVHESQVLELAQTSHPTSVLSTLLGKHRLSWDERKDENGDAPIPPVDGALPQFRAGLKIDAAAQMVLRDRLDMVFASHDARARCLSKLDGLRSAGVEVVDTPNVVEPHREIARRAMATLNPNRQTNTFFDARTGHTTLSSIATAEPQASKLYGVILPFEIANMSHDYIIVDPDMDDSVSEPTRFLAVKKFADKPVAATLFKPARVNPQSRWKDEIGKIRNEYNDNSVIGLRVLLKINQAGAATSLGELSSYLHNHGVRHAVIMNGDASGARRPTPHFIDIEFADEDLADNLMRKLFGSIVGGALHIAFKDWKKRGVQVLGAMPFREHQLPEIKKRRG